MRAYGGRVFCRGKHLERLTESCLALNEPLPLSVRELERWLDGALRESGHADALLRLAVHWDGAGAGRLVLFIRPFKSHPKEWHEKGVELRAAVPLRFSARAQSPQIKASQYVNGVLASLDAPQVHESLFFGPAGTVAEGTVSNLFLVKGKWLLTPSVASGILKGVTRDLVIALAEKRGWPVRQTGLTRHEFYTADECFLTNTSSEVLPVVKLDGRVIGTGRPGPRTRILAGDFKKLR